MSFIQPWYKSLYVGKGGFLKVRITPTRAMAPTTAPPPNRKRKESRRGCHRTGRTDGSVANHKIFLVSAREFSQALESLARRVKAAHGLRLHFMAAPLQS